MSNLARTPESYAAWQRIKRNQELLPHEEPWVALQNCSQELDILAAGMSNWNQCYGPTDSLVTEQTCRNPRPGRGLRPSSNEDSNSLE